MLAALLFAVYIYGAGHGIEFAVELLQLFCCVERYGAVTAPPPPPCPAPAEAPPPRALAPPSAAPAAPEQVLTDLSDEVNSELDVKWSEMKSYDEGGSSLLFLSLLAAMVALACFNIWRKVRRRNRNQY